LALALLAGPSAAGSWAVVVGCPQVGLAAAAEAGVALERLALVAEPPPGEWASVVAACIGAVDLVVVGPDHRVRAGDVRRLAARARERGTILVHLDRSAGRARASTPWPLQPEVQLIGVEARWQGLGPGHGHLWARRLVVEAGGRRQAARRRRVELWLPDLHGAITTVATPVRSADGPSSAAEAYAGSDADRLVEPWRHQQAG
jgi:hypothetical protein